MKWTDNICISSIHKLLKHVCSLFNSKPNRLHWSTQTHSSNKSKHININDKSVWTAYVLVKVAMDLHHGLEDTALSFPESESLVGKPEVDTTDPRRPERNWGDSLNNRLEFEFLKATVAIDGFTGRRWRSKGVFVGFRGEIDHYEM